ncbi:MAG: type II secretion system protein [Sedimentisphaerales bacterium]|nr:type II secretion system protein [Sedimentisphaerales bacterium]
MKDKAIKGRGFTLVELMVTTVLVAIIIPAAIKGLTIVSSLASQSAHRAIALDLAEYKLVELIATEQWQTTGQLEGDFAELENMGLYSWQFDSSDSGSLKQLDVTVKWSSRGLDKTLTLTTLKLPADEE